MLERFKSRFFVLLRKVHLSPRDAFPVLIILSVLGFYLIKPEKFKTMWIGYAIFAYIAFFVILTWMFYRQVSTEQTTKTKIFWLGVLSFFAGITIYQILIYSAILPQYISQLGAALDIPSGWCLDVSWPTAIDLSVFTINLIGLIISFFGVKSLKYFLGPILYSSALIVFFIIDALSYPKNALADAAFDFFVPGIVSVAVGLMQMLGVNVEISTIGSGNVMIINKFGLRIPIMVDWPCAGVHSLLLYTAISIAFLQFLDIPKMRKLIYGLVGFFGTIFVNILRITTIVFASFYFSADINAFSANLQLFHEYSGELFFIAWIVIFLSAVVLIERRVRRKTTKQDASPLNYEGKPSTHHVKA